MKNLTITYVDRLSRHPEDLPPDVVEIYIDISRKGVEMNIVRDGFIVADHVMHAIESRIQRLDKTNGRGDQPLAVRVGLYPTVSAEWHAFLDDLLRQDDSWAFFVPTAGA